MSWSRASWKLGAVTLMLLIALTVGLSSALARAQDLPSPSPATYGYDSPASSTTRAANTGTNARGGRPGTWTPPGVVRLVSDGVSAAKGAEKTLGPRFAPGKWLPHCEKHAAEFGYKNSVDYLKGARSLVGREGVETFTRANGDRLFYDAARNEFAAMRPDGVLRTYFRPKSGGDYWKSQTGG